MSGRALIVGASTGIGRALARALARGGYDLVLAARSAEELERLARDLETRFGARAECRPFDARDLDAHEAFVGEIVAGGLEGVALCHGDQSEQAEAERDFAKALRMIEVNYVSAVSLLERLAPHFEERRGGWIVALSSVAGDRGRRSNYLYGSTKAALSAYLEGLEARLAPAGVAVVTVKPGFVDTALTWGRVPFAASPDRVAADVVRAIERRRSVVYTPRFWAVVMMLLRAIPRPLFRRLPL